MQVKDPQASEAVGDDGEIGIGDTGIEGTRNGLSEVQFHQACEPIGHSAEHVGAGTCGELLPLGTLQEKPSLAHQPERLLVLVALHPRQNRTQLVVRQRLVYAQRYDVVVDRIRSHWCRGKP